MTIRRNGHRSPVYARALAAFRWRMKEGLVPVYGARPGVMGAIRRHTDTSGGDAA